MPKERLERLDAASRTRLFDVALREFAAHGFERASLNAILAEAGLSKGSYYYYFDDKRDLLFETLRVEFERLRALAPIPDTALTRETFWSQLAAHNQRVAERIARHPHLVTVVASLHRAHLLDPFFEPLRAKMRDLYLPSLLAGQKLGRVRADVPLPTLMTVWEAADAALDASAPITGITSARIVAHATLAFDLFRRIFEARDGTAVRARSRSATKRSPRSR